MVESKQNSHMDLEDDGSHSKIGNYLIIRFLDKGAQGKVKLCYNMTKKQIYAIKISKNLSNADKADMQREFNAINKVGKHENILEQQDFFEGTYIKKQNKGQYTATCLVLEYIDNGCLFDYVKAMGGFHSAIAKYYFINKISALKCMHDKGVSHRDIKLENTLLSKNYVLKICDFGFAGEAGVLLNDNLGTQSYKAPEIHLRKPYLGEKADVFSAGVCFFIFCFGHYPFSKATQTDGYFKMFVKNNQGFWQKHINTLKQNDKKTDFIDQDFVQLMNNMFNPNFELRWDTNQILNSNYVKRQEQVKVNQEIIAYNLNMYKKQVDDARKQDLEEQKQRKNNNNNDGGNSDSRAVPQSLKKDIEAISTEFKDKMEITNKLRFQRHIPFGLENSSLQIVLRDEEVIPVLVYILRNIEVEGFEFDSLSISEGQKGKLKANYVFEEENVSVVTQVEKVVEKEQQTEESLNVFSISLARNDGEYLYFRQVYEQFAELSKKFA